jgi:competence protein ComEC
LVVCSGSPDVDGRRNNRVHGRGNRSLPLNGGDSIFVDAAGRKNDLLVDCGNEFAVELVVKPFLRSQGVNHLASLLLTHGDLRHIGGTESLVREYGVDRILTSSVPSRSGKLREIVDSQASSSGSLQKINRGDRTGNWTVLHPASNDRFREADDNALVLRGEWENVRILLLSDLGRPGQNALLEREADLRADIVVCGIPVHGEPLGDPLLDAIQPRAIIVSASEVPSQERATRQLRERLENRGVPVFYTSDDGAVTITVRPGGWEVCSMNGKRFSVGGHRSVDVGTKN